MPAVTAPLSAATPCFRDRVPNLLTVSRFVLAAAFFILLTPQRHHYERLIHAAPGQGADSAAMGHPIWVYLIAAGIFAAGALTDALDGHLARRWNATTRFGRIVDPVADKVLVLGALVFLAGPGFTAGATAGESVPMQASGIYPWMVVVILVRELLVTSLRSHFEADGVAFPAVWSGKLKMILQSLAVPVILIILALTSAEQGSAARWGIDLLVWMVVLVTIWSGVPYLRRAARAAKGHSDP